MWLESNLDKLIICSKCSTLQNRVKLPKGAVARCNECNAILYRNVNGAFSKGVAFSITSLILYIIALLFPIINVTIAGVKSSLTIPGMIYSLFSEDFIVVGSIVIVVLVIAPLSVILSYLLLAVIIKLKRYKNLARHIISFLIVSRDWEMIDIFAVSILVALVKLFGYAEVEFGVSAIALALFVIVDIFVLKNIKATELWTHFVREYSEK
jgi:paraquat-inducible protein A